jgi:cytochrome c oxidase subunit 1
VSEQLYDPVDPQQLAWARRLTVRYLVLSTVVFFAAGLLGLLLRFSQGDVGRIGTNTWYAVMTAHGLGAFLGWAGFAVMGFSWWVLASVGFGPRRFGYAMGNLAFWLMGLGVAGVLVSTLAMSFAASWVFLYPLPFHAAGQWGEWATAIFLGSVLLVGGSIIVWCLGIVHTTLGPALHAVRGASVFNRFGLAIGLGYMWPKRFATNPRPVPYPVIPLAVIGIDMIIATTPLAFLLIVMIVQTFHSSTSVDPLLAKNILWFFGHPVVYLLLFPAVAILYLLVPRYAGRPLVAGNVVALAWLVGVLANVIIFAHHVYLDYPENSIQAAVNTSAQPITYAIVLPSALSLYSLGFTIHRSQWRWTAATTALFLALVSWLAAGLSGIVNATIAFDVQIHNTLWVVGHFHHMALLNIGLVVIGATYAFLPEFTGRPIWSESLGKWHVWLTFVFGTVNTLLWLWQGLEGAPRRFAVLPSEYDSLSRWALPVAAVLGLAQILFLVNLVQSVRDIPPRSVTRPEGGGRDAVAWIVAVLAALGLLIPAGVVVHVLTTETGGRTAASTTTTAPSGGAGAAVFASAGCANCHTLEKAGAHGTVGPNLTNTRLSVAQVVTTVTNGRPGTAMPSFKGTLTPAQIRAVAGYVAGG